MRKQLAGPVIFLLLFGVAIPWSWSERPLPKQALNKQVFFSPNGGPGRSVADAIDIAKTSVLAQVYSLTSTSIAKSLVHARNRGVDVQVILDAGQMDSSGSQGPLLVRAGIPVRLDAVHAAAQNTVMIIDSKMIVTGVPSYTMPPEGTESGNLVIVDDMLLAIKYIQDWNDHRDHSELCR